MISLSEFFTTSILIDNSSTVLMRLRNSVSKSSPTAFMEKYTIKISPMGAAVYDGDKLIATMGQLTDIFVDPNYRGQNIAANMICKWFLSNETYRPRQLSYRSKFGQKSYSKAWEMIKSALPDNKDINP